MTPDIAMLAEVPLFALLGAHERRALAELFNTVQLQRDDAIFSYGDAGDSLYIVRKGRVRIFMEDARGQRIVLAENGPGEIFGEISLLDGGPRTASAEAAENTVLLMLNRDDLLEFITKHPGAALSLLTVMGQRLRATNELLRSNASKNVNQAEDARLTGAQRLTSVLAYSVGSWAFVAVFLCGLAMLISWAVGTATLESRDRHLLIPNLILTALVVLQSAFVLMLLNRQMSKDRLKADLDYDFNLKEELALGQLAQDIRQIRDQLSEPEKIAELPAASRAARA